MNGFLSELGKRLAEKWLTLLVLPGLLYLGTLAVARTARWAHALDITRIVREIDRLTGQAHPRTQGFLVLTAVLVLLASAGAGLAAQALGSVVAVVWLAEGWERWPRPARALARRRTAVRTRKWAEAAGAYRAALAAAARAMALAQAGLTPPAAPPGELPRLHRALTDISLEEPARPSRLGDRIAGVAVALDRRLELDLATVWPYLWLTFPENTAREITAARDAFQRAATLAGWGVLCLVPGVLWWPALIAAVALWATAVRRARGAVDAYAAFVAAAVELHTPELVRTLGIGTPEALDRDTGRALTRRLQGRAW